jgi:hypothetical protein
LVREWFGDDCGGIAYRSRTTPQRSANLAFFRHAQASARSLGRLADQRGLLIACAVSDGFAFEEWPTVGARSTT